MDRDLAAVLKKVDAALAEEWPPFRKYAMPWLSRQQLEAIAKLIRKAGS